MTIPARYSGVCPECGERWQPGDLIRTVERATEGLPTWQHATCPVIPDAADLRPGEILCADCWLIHPHGGGAR